jgi:hypothetical protein
MPQDIWVCASFPFEGVIADTLNDRVVEIHFDDQKLMRSWPIREVSSVWGSYELQQEKHIAWVAVNDEGLWMMNVIANTSGGMIKPSDIVLDNGDVMKEHGSVVKVADIPNAFWVRVCGLRVFVLTMDLGLYEYDSATGQVIELIPRRTNSLGSPYDASFAFMNFDETGTIGPPQRLYWSFAQSKTSVYWYDINDGTSGTLGRQGNLLNRVIYGSFMANSDPFGHYMWAFAPHATLPKAIANGICSTSWFLWSACLGDLPVADPKLPYNGIKQWREGVMDEYIPPSIVWGSQGHGMIGYSADEFRDYRTWEEARDHVLEALEPFFWPALSDAGKEDIGKQLFAQRTRTRFQRH